MNIKKIAGIGAVIGAACTSALVAPAPAMAADPPPLVIYKNGVLKAQSSYNEATNEFCTRVFNSNSGSKAILTVTRSPAVKVVTTGDVGGDNDKTCTTVDSYWEGKTFHWKLAWNGSAGDALGAEGDGVF